MFISSIVSELRGIVNRHDDDSVDRYNHRYTVMILAIFIFIISSKQYFGEPIVSRFFLSVTCMFNKKTIKLHLYFLRSVGLQVII